MDNLKIKKKKFNGKSWSDFRKLSAKESEEIQKTYAALEKEKEKKGKKRKKKPGPKNKNTNRARISNDPVIDGPLKASYSRYSTS